MSEGLDGKRKTVVAVVDEFGTGVKDLDIGKILSDPTVRHQLAQI